jgi:hypothetical protein
MSEQELIFLVVYLELLRALIELSSALAGC